MVNVFDGFTQLFRELQGPAPVRLPDFAHRNDKQTGPKIQPEAKAADTLIND
jgi:hypothetical protein